MKNKLFAAALAAVTLAGAAMPAAAQDFRGDGYRGDYNQDFRGNRGDLRDIRRMAQITIRQDGRQISFDRRDRMFYRLMDRPFNFQPGMTYVYTDRCSRDACMVLVFSPWSRRPIDRIWAPRPGRFFFARGDRDGRWNDRGDDRGFNDGGPYRGDDHGDRAYPR